MSLISNPLFLDKYLSEPLRLYRQMRKPYRLLSTPPRGAFSPIIYQGRPSTELFPPATLSLEVEGVLSTGGAEVLSPGLGARGAAAAAASSEPLTPVAVFIAPPA